MTDKGSAQLLSGPKRAARDPATASSLASASGSTSMYRSARPDGTGHQTPNGC